MEQFELFVTFLILPSRTEESSTVVGREDRAWTLRIGVGAEDRNAI